MAELYQDIIQKIQPKLIVGHSLGGYWALKMSQLFRIPAIVANPSLHPDFRADYAPITEYDLEHDIPQTAYIELGDEILDMYETSNILEPYMYVEMMQGGHHRLASPENLNRMIEYMQDTFVI
ncbi:YqiA/YcfP family alpha/beta fold hydrolase [Acinetobacter defluvii]|uniref:YqiA/YcfP family alpha/beta fold hydrolase n=1 Tax=Acinetobacter defluvii TaxID=1871111 RepID=UPI003AF608F8